MKLILLLGYLLKNLMKDSCSAQDRETAAGRMKDAARAVRMQNQEDPVRMDVTDEENMMEITETEQDKEKGI